MTWIPCSERLPDDGVAVETKIANPDRNECLLVRQGTIWFFADRSMYVYYSPSHWRPASRERLKAEADHLRRVAAETSALADRIEGQKEAEKHGA